MAPAEMDDAGRAAIAGFAPELLQVLGVRSRDEGSWDSSASLSASDLRALVNKMQVRSDQVKDRVRRCVLSQKEEFSRVIGCSSGSLKLFSEVAQDVETLLTSGASSQNLSDLCSQLSALVQETSQTVRDISGKKETVKLVKRLADWYGLINSASQQLSQNNLIEAAQLLLNAKHELGKSGIILEEVDVPVGEYDVMPYALIRQHWLSTFSKISGHLDEIFSKVILFDAKDNRLKIHDGHLLFEILTAMDKIGLLGTSFAKFADSLMKSVISSILCAPVDVELNEKISPTGDATLSWNAVSNSEEDILSLSIVYSKLLKVFNFLREHVSCGHNAWTKELGRFLWPRLADAIISTYLSKAVPNELSEVTKFQELASLTFEFEASLSKLHFINEPGPLGDKLGQFVSDVEVHFVSKKKSRLIARVRRLLVRFDFKTLYRDHKAASGTTHRTELFFQAEQCVISHAAKQVADIVHGVLGDACAVSAKISLELYHTARDLFLLYAAIVPVKLVKELKELSLEAVIHHNDCLYLAHESLALKYQYLKLFPLELSERCIFVDLFLCLQELADQVLNQQLQLSLANLNKALDEGNGFRCTHEVHFYEIASLSLDQVVINLEKVRMLWQPLMSHSIYASSMGFLMTLIFGRIASEILEIEDLDHRETEQLHEMIFSLDDRLLPLMQSLVDDGKHDLTDGKSSSSLNEVGLLVPTWCKLLRLAELLNMPSASIAKAWENGSLVLCGFSSIEVQNLIRAMFQDSEKRKESVRRVALKMFPEGTMGA